MKPLAWNRRRLGWALFAAAACLAGCSKPAWSPYSPHENLLSIVGDYQLVRAVNIYREDYPHDLTGQNIARATLVRLANYEEMYPGRYTPDIEMIRGEALMDLGDYASARRRFSHCAEYDTSLRGAAREGAAASADFEETLARALSVESPEAHLADLDRQWADLQALGERYRASRWENHARIEIENAEIARAEFLIEHLGVLLDGEARALQALENLVRNHPKSRRGLGHAMRLAEFHLELARRMERLGDPERGSFDLTPAADHLESALDILYRVTQADGRPEKILAQHRLDEILAYYDILRRRAK